MFVLYSKCEKYTGTKHKILRTLVSYVVYESTPKDTIRTKMRTRDILEQRACAICSRAGDYTKVGWARGSAGIFDHEPSRNLRQTR